MGTAIVTGASRGIGRAIAERLAKDNFSIVVNYLGSAKAAEEVVQSIKAGGGRAIAVQGNVASAADTQVLFDAAKANFGGVDVLVNNAGLLEVGPLGEADDETFDRLFSTNVRGAFNGMRAASKHLSDNGRIINFSSTTLFLNAPGYGIYNGTKGAIEGMSRVLAKELGPRGITVNVVAPGPVETDMFMTGKSEAEVARLAGVAPLGRLGRPHEIAELVGFLASAEAGWVNGQIIRANGGIG